VDLGAVLLGGAALSALAFGLVQLVLYRRHHARSVRALAHAEERGKQPLSLHPVIDPALCIGSVACVKACPEGDILGIVDGASQLVNPDRCIGHGECAAQCPVDAIKLVVGTAQRGVDLPEVDEHFETSRRGVHVIGELGGMGLIRNATVQGTQLARRFAEVLRPGAGAGLLDVAVVGAGPSGLVAAAGLREAGLDVRVLEQETFGGTIAQYPRQKLAMTEPVPLPFGMRLPARTISKEKLLEAFQALVARSKVPIDEGCKVLGLEGQDGDFQIKTSKGEVRARKVVLAVGLRGTPRKLGVPGEDQQHVTYRLTDAEQYDGCKVLIVGGGDAALEAAIQLAERGEASVALSYRGAELGRCREANRLRFSELADEGRVCAHFQTELASIGERDVTLRTPRGGASKEPADFVIICAGGELPLEFLAKAGVSLRRYHGEEPGAPRAEADQRARAGSARKRSEQRKRQLFTAAYVLVGAAILAWLTWQGFDYYRLPRLARLKSPLHESLRPAGHRGHLIGLIATAVMLSNFLYPARKRLSFMSRVGTARGWLGFHVFVGLMSPLVIAFHAAFLSNNLLATFTAASLGVVVLTGLIGRYVYALVPTEDGRALEESELRARLVRVRDRARRLAGCSVDSARLERLVKDAGRERGHLFLGALIRVPIESIGLRLRLFLARGAFGDRAGFLEYRDDVLRLARLRTQVSFIRSLRKLLRGWRMFHAGLAVFLVLAISAHIGVSIYLGYGFPR
jgi:thioredoxin reductase/NAD-dependent dihydropyrimidine dehydrogenase PreA subunit